MYTRYGFGEIIENLGINTTPDSIPFEQFKIARVVDIILDETHPLFNPIYGEWDSIGTIFYQDLNIPLPTDSHIRQSPSGFFVSILPFARPFYSNIKQYPLINEVVLMVNSINVDSREIVSNDASGPLYYYIANLNVWGNNQHQNALPQELYSNTLPTTQQKTYEQASLGSTSKISSNDSNNISLGNTFEPRSDIHPLRPFEGDIIYEGRWGNSVRFGSTVKDTPNNWSTTGSNGDPITIIRNGQGERSPKGYINIVEDINIDDSSIYLTSTQQVPIEVSSINNYDSYQSNPPTQPNQYAGEQVILNSGRLVFNTTADHLLLSSKKSINLNAVESINFDTTGNVILSSNKVFLGSKDAPEPVLLGDSTVTLLRTLLIELAELTNTLSTQIGVPAGALLAPTSVVAGITNATINNLINQLDGLKSQTTFTE
jgi:hypothetical protein